jgi:hypothetical protein
MSIAAVFFSSPSRRGAAAAAFFSSLSRRGAAAAAFLERNFKNS